MSLPCLAFLLTPNGLGKYRSMNSLLQQTIKSHALLGAKIYASERLIYNVDFVSAGFTEYIKTPSVFPAVTKSNYECFWKTIVNVTQHKKELNEFAKLASEVVQIPCSEAPVERFFSHLEKILSPNRRKMKPDLVRALSIIKMNHLFSNEMKKNLNYSTLEENIIEGINAMKQAVFIPPVSHYINKRIMN